MNQVHLNKSTDVYINRRMSHGYNTADLINNVLPVNSRLENFTTHVNPVNVIYGSRYVKNKTER